MTRHARGGARHSVGWRICAGADDVHQAGSFLIQKRARFAAPLPPSYNAVGGVEEGTKQARTRFRIRRGSEARSCEGVAQSVEQRTVKAGRSEIPRNFRGIVISRCTSCPY